MLNLLRLVCLTSYTLSLERLTVRDIRIQELDLVENASMNKVALFYIIYKTGIKTA